MAVLAQSASSRSEDHFTSWRPNRLGGLLTQSPLDCSRYLRVSLRVQCMALPILEIFSPLFCPLQLYVRSTRHQKTVKIQFNLSLTLVQTVDQLTYCLPGNINSSVTLLFGRTLVPMGLCSRQDLCPYRDWGFSWSGPESGLGRGLARILIGFGSWSGLDSLLLSLGCSQWAERIISKVYIVKFNEYLRST